MNAPPSQSSGSASDSDGSLLQNSAYVGITIQNILYGVELVLYFKTMRILLRNKQGLKKIDLFWGLFSTMMVFLITVWVTTSAIFGQKLWLMNSDFPGGPDEYWVKHLSDWYLDWGTTAVILLQLMTDGLMIYRCRIIWNMYRAIVVPVILWLATLVLGVLVDWTSSSPGGNFFTGESAQLVLAYYAVSVFLNTVLTCMICYRILQYGKKVRKDFGRERASLYFGVVTLVIESVLPYTLSGIAFLVSLGVNSPTSAGIVDVYCLLMCISPQMLIVRVLAGRAWNNNMSKRPDSMIHSSSDGSSGSQQIEGNAATVHLTTSSEVHLPDGHEKVVVSPV